MSIDREKLKQKYGDEEVLVVPLNVIKDLGLDEKRLLKMSPLDSRLTIDKLTDYAYYIPRWESDNNPDEVEPISYITFVNDNQIFTYKRVKNGDSRGDGAFSIGVGGHINPCDSDNPIFESAKREVEEELGMHIDTYEFEYAQFIRCKDSDYDRDHLGINFIVKCNISEVAEKDKMCAIGMVNDEALKQIFYDKLENWTKIIVDDLGGEASWRVKANI